MNWTVYQSFKYRWEWWVTLEMEGDPVNTACSLYCKIIFCYLRQSWRKRGREGKEKEGDSKDLWRKAGYLTVTFFLKRVTKFTFTLPEKDLSDRKELLMSNCVGGGRSCAHWKALGEPGMLNPSFFKERDVQLISPQG